MHGSRRRTRAASRVMEHGTLLLQWRVPEIGHSRWAVGQFFPSDGGNTNARKLIHQFIPIHTRPVPHVLIHTAWECRNQSCVDHQVEWCVRGRPLLGSHHYEFLQILAREAYHEFERPGLNPVCIRILWTLVDGTTNALVIVRMNRPRIPRQELGGKVSIQVFRRRP